MIEGITTMSTSSPQVCLSSGGPEVRAVSVSVEELQQHQDGAAGAAAAHDVEGEQPSVTAARRPGVSQLRLLLLSNPAFACHTCAHPPPTFIPFFLGRGNAEEPPPSFLPAWTLHLDHQDPPPSVMSVFFCRS